MANNRFNSQIQTVPEKTSGGKGVFPKVGQPSQTNIPIRSAAWPGLPGKAQSRDRSCGVPGEKIYTQAVGLVGGEDSDDVGGGPGKKDF